MTLPPRAGLAQKNAAEAIDPSGKSLDNSEYPMKKLLLSAALFSAFAAHATCGHNGIPNEVCDQPPVPVTPVDPIPTGNVSASGTGGTGTGTAKQRQVQKQQQAQQQAQRQQAQANGNGAYSGSNAVTIQGAQAGSGDRTLVLSLPSVPATPPSFVASAVMTMMWSPCGPLVRILSEEVYGEARGLFGWWNTRVYLGMNEKTVEYYDINGNLHPYTAINGRWFGHSVLYSGAVPGVASGTNLTIGGAGAGGGGQAGGGTSGGMQRPVERVQYRLCDAGPVVIAAPHVVYKPRAFYMPIVRKHRPAPSPCVLEDKLIRVCKRT